MKFKPLFAKRFLTDRQWLMESRGRIYHKVSVAIGTGPDKALESDLSKQKQI